MQQYKYEDLVVIPKDVLNWLISNTDNDSHTEAQEYGLQAKPLQLLIEDAFDVGVYLAVEPENEYAVKCKQEFLKKGVQL